MAASLTAYFNGTILFLVLHEEMLSRENTFNKRNICFCVCAFASSFLRKCLVGISKFVILI